MYTFQHNPARFCNCNESCITIVQHKHTKILGLKGKRQISIVQSAEQGSLVTVVNYESNWTLHSSVTYIYKKIYETRTDEWHTAWINPRVPSLGVFSVRDFHPVVCSFHQTYKADKIIPCYLSTGRALFTHKGHWGSLLWLERIMLTFFSHLTTVTQCNAWI
jgi:hypothetical protein